MAVPLSRACHVTGAPWRRYAWSTGCVVHDRIRDRQRIPSQRWGLGTTRQSLRPGGGGLALLCRSQRTRLIGRMGSMISRSDIPDGEPRAMSDYVDAFLDRTSFHHSSSSSASTCCAVMNTLACRLHIGRCSRSNVNAGRSHSTHVLRKILSLGSMSSSWADPDFRSRHKCSPAQVTSPRSDGERRQWDRPSCTRLSLRHLRFLTTNPRPHCSPLTCGMRHHRARATPRPGTPEVLLGA